MSEGIKTIILENEVSPIEIKQIENKEAYKIEGRENSAAIIYQMINSGTENKISIELKEDSRLELFTYNNGSESFSTTLEVTLEENSEFVLYNLLSKNSSTTINQVVNLKGINASALINNYLIGINDQKITHQANIDHNFKKTNSKIQNFCIAKDQSKIFCDNTTTIIKGAKDSNAYQKTKGILVGKKSLIEVNPNLYIDEYDVMAGHGASIGSLSKDDLFYLMSRGLTKEEAEHLAVVSLVNPLLDQIKLEHYKKLIISDLEQILK